MKGKDLLSVADLSPEDTIRIIDRAREMKEVGTGRPLAGKSIALLFEKASLRTRASFQVGIQQLRGFSFFMGPEEVGLGVREPVSDVARVMSGYVDCIIARVVSHQHLVELGKYASVPVINALSDWEHPCQTMTDLLTIAEHFGNLEGLKLAFIGDGNNVSRSLCLGLPAVGMSFTIASPPEYNLDEVSLNLARERATRQGVQVQSVVDPDEAVRGADIVYTDTWVSMGQEAETADRRRAFRGYYVDADRLAQAKPNAVFMHDMPAHYGDEVPAGMLDHPQSIAFAQAHNRLHAQKAILEFILGRT